MKKIVLILPFFFLMTTIGFSQLDLDFDKELRLGFQLSPSFSWMSTDDNLINGNGLNLGLKLGMVGEYYFRENYALVSGINLAFNQGGTLRHEEGGDLWPKSALSDLSLHSLPDGVNLKYHIQYLEIPFGVKLRTKEFGYLRYFAEIPIFSLGFKLQARGDVKGTTLDNERENITEDVNLFNLTWGFGGGVQYTLSESTALVGGIIYRQGFTDVTDDSGLKIDGTTRENSKGIIKSLTIRLGFLF
ncbi:MAG: porin family protein [Saprospiraceae bacterium]